MSISRLVFYGQSRADLWRDTLCFIANNDQRNVFFVRESHIWSVITWTRLHGILVNIFSLWPWLQPLKYILLKEVTLGVFSVFGKYRLSKICTLCSVTNFNIIAYKNVLLFRCRVTKKNQTNRNLPQDKKLTSFHGKSRNCHTTSQPTFLCHEIMQPLALNSRYFYWLIDFNSISTYQELFYAYR